MWPVIFQWGSVQVYSFGLMVAAGVLVAIFLMGREAEKTRFPTRDQIFDLVFFTVLSGFAGARFLYVIEHWADYQTNPLMIFAFWEGGLIFYGGLIASLAGLFLFFRIRQLPPLKTLDFLVPYVALCHAFGRVGCFLNGCCLGDICQFAWAVRFPGESVSRHPVQLYEALLDLGLFLALQRVKKKSYPAGLVSCGYFAGYALIRFVVESVRRSNPVFFYLTHNQWLSILIFALSLAAAAFIWRRSAGKQAL